MRLEVPAGEKPERSWRDGARHVDGSGAALTLPRTDLPDDDVVLDVVLASRAPEVLCRLEGMTGDAL